MKIYNYRNFLNLGEEDFRRLSNILSEQLFWCARPDDLNDPDEFVWLCDYAPSNDTVELVAQLLVHD